MTRATFTFWVKCHNRIADIYRDLATYRMTVSVFAQPPLTIICGKLAPSFSRFCAPPTRGECPLIASTMSSLIPGAIRYLQRAKKSVQSVFASICWQPTATLDPAIREGYLRKQLVTSRAMLW